MAVVLMSLACMMSSCGDDVIKDYYPIYLGFEIVSPDGKDLIAENGSLYGSDFSVTFKGEVYDAVWEEKSREYSPRMFGLRYCKDGSKAMLTFGELSGDEGESDLCLNMPGRKQTRNSDNQSREKRQDETDRDSRWQDAARSVLLPQ